MGDRITMAGIAAMAGVSQATVSLSLAGHARIPEATRSRIRALAARMGYRPHPYVSALMRLRREGREHSERPVVALVSLLESERGWRRHSSHTVREMREGAIRQAERRGYRTEEFWVNQDGMTPERFSRMLFTRGIEGLLLSPPPVGEAPTPPLSWELFAVVNLSVPIADLTCTTVCNDHFFSTLQVALRCADLGYRRPGLVILAHHRERFQCRWDGGLAAACMLRRGIEPATTLQLPAWDSLAALGPWLDRERPDLLIAPSAEVLLPHLRRLGLRVPRDLGVASLACPAPDHPCSGIHQNGEHIGSTAMDALISQIERNERGLPAQAQTIMVQGVWNPGRTLRPARRGRV